MAVGEAIRQLPREVFRATRAVVEVELPALPLLLFLVRGSHSRNCEFGAIQVTRNCDRVAGCFRQVFLGA